jgi:iron complex outermembrane receptor protein
MTKKLRYLTRVLPVLPMLLVGSVYAQEPDRVIVTGSLIPTAEEVTASPVDTIGARDIQRSGSVEVLQVLQKREADITGAGNLGSTNANIASGATLGGSVVQIRGLPTLILDEGRRITDSAAIASGGFQFSDVNLFPSALVSRIEVLKDGASAQYGSDAVGGVINIFLKHDFKGVEIGYRYGFTVDSGNQNTLVWVIAGTGNDTTNITVGYQYYQTSGLFERERAYSQVPGGVTTTYHRVGRDRGTFAGAPLDPNPRSLLNPNLNSPFDNPAVLAGIGTFTGYLPTTRSGNNILGGNTRPLPAGVYNYATFAQITAFDLSRLPTSTLQQSNQNVIASFTHDIFGKRLELFGDFLYAYDHNTSFLNGQPLSNNTGIVIPAGRAAITNADGSVTPAIFNPFNFAIGANTFTVAQRFQTNPRIFTDDTNFVRLLGGLRSQITKDYTFETAYFYSNYAVNFQNSNLVRADVINNAIANLGYDFFNNPRNTVGTGPGQVSAATFNSFFGTNIRDLQTYQKVIDAKFTGFPFSLPAGPFGFAIGGEYRQEGLKAIDSPEIFVGSVPIADINRNRGIWSIYAELSIPLVSPQMKIPGVYSLELSLAGRHDHYDGIRKDANVPKIQVRWQPIQDLTLRGTFANSFVAPNLFQLFGPASTGFSPSITLFNPLTGTNQPQDQAQVVTGSNPRLVPSTAQSWTAGAVYSPKWLPGLTVSADYFNVLQQGIVGTVGGFVILNSVNNLGPASPYYNQVAFNNFPGRPGAVAVGGPFSLVGNLGSTFYSDLNVNLGAANVAGWDFAINYTLDLKRYGALQLGANAVYYTLNRQRLTQFSPYYNVKGWDFQEGGGGNPNYRFNLLGEYRYEGWALGVTFLYIPTMFNSFTTDITQNTPFGAQLISAYNQTDAYLRYTFAAPKAVVQPKTVVDPKGGPVRTSVDSHFRWYDGLTLTVGCNNVFNHQPPFVSGGNSATDLSVYDPYGRMVYFQVSKKF